MKSGGWWRNRFTDCTRISCSWKPLPSWRIARFRKSWKNTTKWPATKPKTLSCQMLSTKQTLHTILECWGWFLGAKNSTRKFPQISSRKARKDSTKTNVGLQSAWQLPRKSCLFSKSLWTESYSFSFVNVDLYRFVYQYDPQIERASPRKSRFSHTAATKARETTSTRRCLAQSIQWTVGSNIYIEKLGGGKCETTHEIACRFFQRSCTTSGERLGNNQQRGGWRRRWLWCRWSENRKETGETTEGYMILISRNNLPYLGAPRIWILREMHPLNNCNIRPLYRSHSMNILGVSAQHYNYYRCGIMNVLSLGILLLHCLVWDESITISTSTPLW